MTRYIRCPLGVFELRPHRRPILWDCDRGRQTYATCPEWDDDKHHYWTAEGVRWATKEYPDHYYEIPAEEAKKIIQEMKLDR
jgi:hypothetical protein